jgi:hypothetical protein
MKLRARDDVLLSFLLTFTCVIAHNLLLTIVLSALVSVITQTRWDIYLYREGVKTDGPTPLDRMGCIALTWLGGAACGLLAEASYAFLKEGEVVVGLVGLTASAAQFYGMATHMSRRVNKLWSTNPQKQ